MKIEWTLKRCAQVLLLGAMMFALGITHAPWWLYTIAILYGAFSYFAGEEVGNRSLKDASE